MPGRIDGTSGDDTLTGGVGDTLYGAAGNDVYVVSDSSALIVETFGNDTVYTSVSYTLPFRVENLFAIDPAGTTPLVLIGSGEGNIITGNYGDNVIDSGGAYSLGAALSGLRGNDIYHVRDSRDRVYENAGEGTDTIYAYRNYTLGDGASVEILAAAPIGMSTALKGNALVQTIIGDIGNDTLDGGGGADTLIGGANNDVYRVYGNGEVIVEAAGAGNDAVYTSADFYLAAGVSIETISAADQGLSSSMYLLGNEGAQRIIGDYGNNTLNGGGGGDTLIGLYGDDTYRIFSQFDVVTETAGQGNDLIYTSGNYRLAAGTSVETLSTWLHVDTTAMNLTGNELANKVIGNYGVNVLNGGGGADTLIGLEGADVFRFTTAPVAGTVTTIQDYGTGADVILLDSTVFRALTDGNLPASALAYGAAAVDADDRIIYNAATGALSYDADGNGTGAAIQFAQLPTGIALADLRIVVATVPQEIIRIDTPGTYLLGNATGPGIAIPGYEYLTSITFGGPAPAGYSLVFGASTSNGQVPSILFTMADTPGTLDFSQLTQGIVTHAESPVLTASGQTLLPSIPLASFLPNPFPKKIIGTDFDDIIDRRAPREEEQGYSADSIYGGAGNDFIRGAKWADGGPGDDHLFGTLATTLTGGAGADTFDLLMRTRRPPTLFSGLPNTVTDFTPAEDKIQIVLNYSNSLAPNDLVAGALSAAQFGIGSGPISATQRIGYNPETGELSYYVRGDVVRPTGEIPVFAILPKNLTDISADNFTLILP